MSPWAAVAAVAIVSLLAAGAPVPASAGPPLPTGTACPPTHAGVPLAALDGASVYDGDPARNYLRRPNRSEGDARGWHNEFRFDGTMATTVVCKYADGFRHAFMLAPAVRMCRQDVRSFDCR